MSKSDLVAYGYRNITHNGGMRFASHDRLKAEEKLALVRSENPGSEFELVTLKGEEVYRYTWRTGQGRAGNDFRERTKRTVYREINPIRFW